MESGLKPELEQFVEEQVATGRYGSRDEAVNAAVALLREQAEFRAYVQSAIAEADASLARGDYQDYTEEEMDALFEGIKAEGHARLAEGQRQAV